jgi:aldehyde dehydrogenase (NAD+)
VASIPFPQRDLSDIPRILSLQRANRAAVGAASATERIAKLRRLGREIMRRQDEICAAMWEDFRKPPQEVKLSEIFPIVSEIRHAASHLRKWTKKQPVPGRLALLGTSSHVLYQPRGVVLVISPWNFPFNLSLGPLACAVAAGNCVILKPSEMTPASSACMRRILGDVFEENEVAVVEGGAEVSQALLRERFDHIFFTGSPNVGKVVMKAAAENLTSVTLELGGKSPLVVDRSANLDDAARRIAWGKTVNSGQACVAPDYLLVHESMRDVFVEKLLAEFRKMQSAGPRSWIVNDRHAGRLRKLVDSAVAGGGKVLFGGQFGDGGRNAELTIVSEIDDTCDLMQEEIFGPILPMMTFRSLDDVVEIIGRREHPLALYVFATDRDFVDGLIARTNAGGTVVNHTLIHFFQLNLPFGGVGYSGLGKAHGFAGFQAFSNARGVMEQSWPFSSIEMLFPPYTWIKNKLIDFTVRWL